MEKWDAPAVFSHLEQVHRLHLHFVLLSKTKDGLQNSFWEGKLDKHFPADNINASHNIWRK